MTEPANVTDVATAPTAPEPGRPRSREDVLRSMERCTKCGICQVYCPVAAATGKFPGPKYTGPQAQRFRVIEAISESSPNLCSGCGVCTSVCPNDVAITDIIAIAKAEMMEFSGGPTLGQKILNRPDMIGRLGGRLPKLANAVLGNRILRKLAQSTMGIHQDAPLPEFSGPRFRKWLLKRKQPDGPAITYFSGCAVENFDPDVGISTIRVLNHLGYNVDAPTDACCSLPMLSSGEWEPAVSRARGLLNALVGAAETGRSIVSTSTSCSLTLRDKYTDYLNFNDADSLNVGEATVDLCEFLREHHMDALRARMSPLPQRVFYHGPCQLRGHRIGQPAIELLRLIPELVLELSEASCCGIAGTYGYDREKHDVAMAVGKPLFEQIVEARPDVIVCDSETCRWHIEQATGLRTVHPVEIVAQSLSLE